MIKLITIDDDLDFLHTPCKKVENIDDVKNKLDEIIEFCKKEEVYAIAAPQLGFNQRFVVVMGVKELKNKEEIQKQKEENDYQISVYINPIITKKEGLQEFYEACASCNDLTGKVKRPYLITFNALDIEGNEITKTAEGFEAIILSHEIDHLDGVLHIDRATNIQDLTQEERIELRKNEPHIIVKKDGLFEYNDFSKTDKL